MVCCRKRLIRTNRPIPGNEKHLSALCFLPSQKNDLAVSTEALITIEIVFDCLIVVFVSGVFKTNRFISNNQGN